MLKIAFDVDDTLIIPSVATGHDMDTPNYKTIELYKWFQDQGCHMIIWSGSGTDWARRWADKLGLSPDEIRQKQKSDDVDIAFDDCDVHLAKVNVKVSRLNNSVSRKDWNENKPLQFGDYVVIEQKRYGVDNESFLYKVINCFKSNLYVDVPVQSPEKESLHGEIVDVVSCICCGVAEDEVRNFRVEDVGKNTIFNTER